MGGSCHFTILLHLATCVRRGGDDDIFKQSEEEFKQVVRVDLAIPQQRGGNSGRKVLVDTAGFQWLCLPLRDGVGAGSQPNNANLVSQRASRSSSFVIRASKGVCRGGFRVVGEQTKMARWGRRLRFSSSGSPQLCDGAMHTSGFLLVCWCLASGVLVAVGRDKVAISVKASCGVKARILCGRLLSPLMRFLQVSCGWLCMGVSSAGQDGLLYSPRTLASLVHQGEDGSSPAADGPALFGRWVSSMDVERNFGKDEVNVD
nr:hypothetical protein Iba_chr11dCG10090 [Ipomoea batatas]